MARWLGTLDEALTPRIIARDLGGGWVGEEALAIAVACALQAQDMRHGMLLAVNHSGDSDSTGSICGQLLGARDGVEAIPAEWWARLELRQLIEDTINQLVDSVTAGC
jgi:ADP-ribosylglycohydrolase